MSGVNENTHLQHTHHDTMRCKSLAREEEEEQSTVTDAARACSLASKSAVCSANGFFNAAAKRPQQRKPTHRSGSPDVANRVHRAGWYTACL